MVDCPTIRDLDEALAGRGQASDIIAHVKLCDKCRKRAARMRENNTLADMFSGVDSSRLSAALSAGRAGTVDAQVGGFEILEEIHRGGQGVVYRARQFSPNRIVALKMLVHGVFATSRQRHRFDREIELVAGLQHPNIVTLYASGTTEDGRLYFAMEYIAGLSLNEYLRTALPLEAPGSLLKRLHLFSLICDAIGFAHQRGVIHRDLKPSNILVDRGAPTAESGAEAATTKSDSRSRISAIPKVLDFGLAKLMGSQQREAHATQTGEFMGTFAYAAPEQVKGDPDLVDIRTDVYSLGVILYELVTGQHPYPVVGPISDVLRNIAEREPERPSNIRRGISDELDMIVATALAKDADRRYQTAGALRDDIERFLTGEPILAKAQSHWYVLRRAVRRYRRALFVAAAFMLVIAGFAASMTVLAGRLADQRDEAVKARSEATLAAKELAKALHVSNVERGRAMAQSGTTSLAEELLWPEFFADAGNADPASLLEPPERNRRLSAFWGLRELYSRQPCRMTLADSVPKTPFCIMPGGPWMIYCVPGEFVVYDLESFEREASWPNPDIRVSAMAGNSDGRVLAVGYEDGSIVLWDWQARKPLRTIQAHTGAVRRLVFESTGDVLVSGGNDGAIRLWDSNNGSCVKELHGHTGHVGDVCIYRDRRGDRRVASISNPGDMRIWDPETQECLFRSEIFDRRLGSIACDASGTFLVGAFGMGLVVVDAATGSAVQTIRPMGGWVDSMDFHPHKPVVALGSYDKTIKLWGIPSGFLMHTLSGHRLPVRQVAYGADGDLLISKSMSVIKIWDMSEGAALTRLTGHEETVFGAEYSPDGRLIASCGSVPDKRVILWNAASGQIETVFEGHEDTVSAVAFNREGTMLASGGYEGTVRLWDLVQRKHRSTLTGSPDEINSVSFDPSGRYLAAGCDDSVVRIWDVEGDGSPQYEFDLKAGRVPSVDYHPDGRHLVAAGMTTSTLYVLNIPEQRIEMELKSHELWPRAVRYSPDGRLIASGGDDHRIKIWDAATGRLLRDLEGNNYDVFTLAFSRDGFLLASGNRGGVLKLWEPISGICLSTMDDHRGMVFSVAFSPDGSRLISCGRDREIVIRDLTYYDKHIAGNLRFQWDRYQQSVQSAAAP